MGRPAARPETTSNASMSTTFVALVMNLVTMAVQTHEVMYHFPQWSPDGQWILVSADVGGDSDLYLLSPRPGVPPKRLTDNTAADDHGRWIENGRRILFASDRR